MRFFNWLKPVLLTGALAVPLIGSAHADDLVVRLGQQYWPGMSIVAQSEGILEEEFAKFGAKPEYTYTADGAAMNVAMAAGAIDIAMLGTVPAMVAVVNKIPINIIWLGAKIGSIEALVVRDGIESVAELKGRKVAVPFNTTSHFAMIATLEVHGLSKSDIEMVDLTPPDTVPAFARGDVDAVFVWDPHKARLIAEFGAKEIYDSADLERDTKGKAAILDLTYAHTDFIEEHPELVEAYVRVMHETTLRAREDPTWAHTAIQPLMGAESVEDVKAAADGLIFLDAKEQMAEGSMGKIASLLRETALFFHGVGQIERAPDLEEFQSRMYPDALEKVAAGQ